MAVAVGTDMLPARQKIVIVPQPEKPAVQSRTTEVQTFAPRPTITVWIGNTPYQAIVV